MGGTDELVGRGKGQRPSSQPTLLLPALCYPTQPPTPNPTPPHATPTTIASPLALPLPPPTFASSQPGRWVCRRPMRMASSVAYRSLSK